MLYKTNNISKFSIFADGKKIGNTSDLLFDDHFWTVRYLAVMTEGYLERKDVLISPIAIKSINMEDQTIILNLSKKQIEEGPRIDLSKSVSLQDESTLLNYYGWPLYWRSREMPWVTGPYGLGWKATTQIEGEVEHHESADHDHHLRSVNEIKKYSIKTTDDHFGYIDDFLMDETSWMIHYAIIHKVDWLMSGSALIPAQFIKDVSWEKETIKVPLPKHIIRHDPDYIPEKFSDGKRKELDDYYQFHTSPSSPLNHWRSGPVSEHSH